MENVSYLTQLICSSCGNSFSPLQIHTYCQECNAPILAEYDLDSIKRALDRDRIKSRPRGMWRWYELLPLIDPKNLITLGEGDTPLLLLTKLGNNLGLPKLYLKDEANNPTGSFKARGLSVAISKAVELGIKSVLIPSAGNAGGALAAYAARAGLDAVVYMPKSAPSSNFIECQIYGAALELVDGLIDSAGKFAERKTAAGGWFNMSTFKEPYRVEGKKIMGYELAEAFGWFLPDVIIYPTGGGTGLVGMWKAFAELEELGWLSATKRPRMVAVQAEGCAPVVKAFEAKATFCDFWINAHTVA
ncbi:MAG TPA: threonine synthase, partial [Methylococcales bacterium]